METFKMAAASQGVASDAETLPFVVGTLDVALSQSFASTPGAGTTNESLKEVSRGRTLTVEVAKGGLSKLGYTPDSIKLVYLDLNISAHNLGDINMLTSFPHLQSLDVSYNVLRDLAPLSCLPNLNSINASHNKLTRLLDFDPPHSLLFVDYSYNEIEEIPDLTPFSSIKVLNLGGNQITELTGLSGLTSLSTLIVSDNRIERIQGLDNLPIETLDLSSNSIVSVTNLDLLKLLQVVNFSGNQIHSLKGLSHHSYLSVINMAENQIVGLDEVLHLKDIQSLETLDLRKNPLQTLADYRQTVMTQLTTLRVLDGQSLTVEEKVAANNRESSPLEVVAGHHHLQLMCKAARKATRLNFSTLTHVDEPYPMLVLCGPPGSAKSLYSQTLVEEFPSFFGLGVSHTTRPQGSRESHGRDYYFINEATFERALETGEFMQVATIGGYRYGLTMAAIEQVAQQGLACVTHMTLEGVLTLKRSHFEPRYILTLPLNSHIHEQRLRDKDHLTEDDVQQSLNDVRLYQQFHQDRAGFFDATINSDDIQEGYNMLQSIVMAYGDISPETPLTLSLSASRPTTQHTSTTFSILSDNQEGVLSLDTPLGPPPPHFIPPSSSAPITVTALLPRPWSRPSSSGSIAMGTPQNPTKVKKSASDQGTDLKPKQSFHSVAIKAQISAS